MSQDLVDYLGRERLKRRCLGTHAGRFCDGVRVGVEREKRKMAEGKFGCHVRPRDRRSGTYLMPNDMIDI